MTPSKKNKKKPIKTPLPKTYNSSHQFSNEEIFFNLINEINTFQI